MPRKIRNILLVAILLLGVFFAIPQSIRSTVLSSYNAGDKLDSLNGIYVYYNGGMNDTYGRNTINGYNVGLKYQCVEFIKRYYYYHFEHKMPDTWGHAKNFCDQSLGDGSFNKARGLYQYNNGSTNKPRVNDILVFGAHSFNPYGHVAIISKVEEDYIEIIQQNVGTSSRETIEYTVTDANYTLNRSDVLAWLSKQKPL